MSITISSIAQRLAAALRLTEVLSCEESAETIQALIQKRGIARAVTDLNNRWDTRLSAGDYVLYSPARDRFWSEHLGWLVSPEAANGYTEADMRVMKAHRVCGAPDAEFRLFAECELEPA
jgi:hypothetical protein